MANRTAGILLDTSVIIAHLRRQIDILALTLPTEPLFVPLVALGELYKGAGKSANPSRNRELVDDFMEIATLLYPGAFTAEIYADVALRMEAAGRRIPENDIWIAAVALECDLPLATRDAHFSRVEGLQIIKW